MAKEKRTIAGYVRVGLTAEELGKLDEACQYDERCRADFVRIYAVRAAEKLLTDRSAKRTIELMQGNAQTMQGFADGFMSNMEQIKDTIRKK